MAAIVSVESGGNPYAIDDDDAHKSYMLGSRDDAVRIANNLVAIGHNFDAGIAQINSANFAAEGLTTDSVFDVCKNLHAGADILGSAYSRTSATQWLGHAPTTLAESHAQEQLALYHAFSTYNSGDPLRSLAYARSVVAAASGRAFEEGLLARYLPAAENPSKRAVVEATKAQPAPRRSTLDLTLIPPTRHGALPLNAVPLQSIAAAAGLR
jgi:hypothetical protein